MNDDPPRAGGGVYAGLALSTLAVLAYQLLLTRIFSVTVSYHYTFAAVSVTVFGLTLGAILVFFLPRCFAPAVAARRMGMAAGCFAALIVFSFLAHLRTPFNANLDYEGPLLVLGQVAAGYGLLSLPFIAAGVCVTVALTRFPRQVGRLYAADLVGAGLGCLLVAAALRWLDAPTLVIDVAAVAALGGLCCLPPADRRRLLWLSPGLLLLLVTLAVVNAMALRGEPLYDLKYVKGKPAPKPLYQRWNTFSRVAVWKALDEPVGWGLSSRFEPVDPIAQKWLSIDGSPGDDSAGTVMTDFEGEVAPVDFLRYDVTNLAHHIRSDARVLVLGSGGGRDVLAALAFKQPEITAVEVNEIVLEIVNGRYGDFTGHLDRHPAVTFVNDDARRYVARTAKRFEIIQASMINTWAATAAGAYALTETPLYTTEAWLRMIGRLSDRGVLSFSRWHSKQDPLEVYRLTALAVATLRRRGVANPRDHLMIVCRPSQPIEDHPGIATVLVCRRPFSPEDVAAVERVAGEMAFEVLLSPRAAADQTLLQLATCRDLAAFARDFPIDISPPSDDRPFFFDMTRCRDLFYPDQARLKGFGAHLGAAETLNSLLITMALLTGLCVIVPLGLAGGRGSLRGSLPLLVYFGSIGLGFMVVEIALMQRLSMLLGHPIYGMTVVFFCLLVAAGGGSWLSGRLVDDPLRGLAAPWLLALLASVVLLMGLTLSPLAWHFDAASTSTRIALAVGLLLPLGLLMGVAFPLGLRLAGQRAAELTAWLVGINGAASVCGSVLAVILSLTLGITAALLTGAACYLLATASFVWARRQY